MGQVYDIFLSEHRRARQIGRVFQDPMKGTAPHLTIEENLALAYTRKDRKPFRSAVRKQGKGSIPDRA